MNMLKFDEIIMNYTYSAKRICTCQLELSNKLEKYTYSLATQFLIATYNIAIHSMLKDIEQFFVKSMTVGIPLPF